MVRSQVLRTLGESPQADPLTLELLVRAAKPELDGDGMGGAYERKFERYLARRALEKYPNVLQDFLQSTRADKLPAVNRLWAIEVLPKKQKEALFLTLWPQAKLTTLDETTFVSMADMLDNRKIYDLIQPTLHQSVQAKTYVSYALRNESRLQTADFQKMITEPVLSLFDSEDPADIDLALDAVGRFKTAGAREKVVSILDQQKPETTVMLALKALETENNNQEIFARTVEDSKLGFDTRSFALDKLVKTDSAAGQKALSTWIPQLADAEKAKVAGTLSASQRGAAIVLDVYGKKPAHMAVLSPAVAERLAAQGQDAGRSQAMRADAKKKEVAKREEVKAKIKKYSTLAAKNSGDSAEGKLLFQTCLLCHQVGNDGQNIAPALDGSASRETQALLTAILDPDAAVESGYAVYRVEKKDGSVVEGYLVGKESGGTTLAFMGGSKMYIKAAEIKSQSFLPNRSFMAKGLIDQYSDKQVADLLSYIQTLK